VPEVCPRKTVTAPIISPRTREELNGSMRVLSLTFSQDALLRLNGIFLNPGRAAPEAYGW
jgi:aryl-alcohol dehydrogenase-like predicted oxidoreductase